MVTCGLIFLPKKPAVIFKMFKPIHQARRFSLQLLCGLVLSLALVGLMGDLGVAQSVERITQIDQLPVGYPLETQNAVIFWDNVALNAIRALPPGPPAAARALAMIHTAQYEAWSQYSYTAVGSLLGDRYRQWPAGDGLGDKTEAMSYAAYRVLVDLFPDMVDTFDWQMGNYGFDPSMTTTDPYTPAGLGNLAAAAVLAYRHDDGANQLGDRHPGAYTDYTGYEPVNSPNEVVDLNRWQPLATPNGNFQGGCIDNGFYTTQTFIGPHWGNVMPFALNDGEPIIPSAEPAYYPSEAFTQQALDIVAVSAHLTQPQKAMAEYWADGPSSEFPPGHWALFGQVVSLRDEHTLDEDAKLFFALSNANLDAGILAWGIKRDYDSVRPITAIQELFRGQRIRAWAGPYEGTRWINGEDWMPYQAACFVSPAFAEFVSGHSTFSAASAEVLAAFTDSDAFGYSDRFQYSEVEYMHKPVELTWATFSDAADEAGMSRRYGGIHFAPGDLIGRELGREVGDRVWEKSQAFWQGRATPVADLTAQLDQFVATDDFEESFAYRFTSAVEPNRAVQPRAAR